MRFIKSRKLLKYLSSDDPELWNLAETIINSKGFTKSEIKNACEFIRRNSIPMDKFSSEKMERYYRLVDKVFEANGD